MNAETKVENANLSIWNAVSKTDPAHTKKVNQRGGFTAINANYQIREATRQFGPIGLGWGYVVGEAYPLGPFIIVPVTLWHGKRENTFGPILGCAEIMGQRPDHDAPKKAMTDAITKGLSQLGFNADVFLGMFDDSKYVEEVGAEFREAEKVPGIQKIKDRLRLLQNAGNAPDITLDKFNAFITESKDDLSKIRDANHSWWTGDGEDFEGFKAWIVRRRGELAEPAEDSPLQGMIRSMKETETKRQLANWMEANEKAIEQLEDADGRSFQLALDMHESAIQLVDAATAGG